MIVVVLVLLEKFKVDIFILKAEDINMAIFYRRTYARDVGTNGGH